MALVAADHWAYFGDGNAAQILDFKEVVRKSTGVKFIKFILVPSGLIEQQYEIADKQDQQSRAIIMEYPENEVVFLHKGTARTRVWIMLDFMGGSTVASRRTQDLTETLNDTDRLLRSAEAAKNRAYQELEKERQQQMMAIRTKIDMVREVAKARGRVDDDDDDMSADGPD